MLLRVIIAERPERNEQIHDTLLDLLHPRFVLRVNFRAGVQHPFFKRRIVGDDRSNLAHHFAWNSSRNSLRGSFRPLGEKREMLCFAAGRWLDMQ